MSNQYTDVRVIECGRLNSEQAMSGNDEDFSLWTNNLTEILHLEPGDTINTYGAFISQRGAGAADSIEVRGRELGEIRSYQYVDFAGVNEIAGNSQGFKKIVATPIDEEHQLRDDTLRFTMSYYIPSNIHNSLQLPRRHIYAQTPANYRLNWTTPDSILYGGASYNQRDSVTGTTPWPDKSNYYRTLPAGGGGVGANDRMWKYKNNNEKFTLLCRDVTYLTDSATEDDFNVQDMRDPENAEYYILKEMKAFTIPAGFNSAEFVANEITRQFQEITSNKVVEAVNDDAGNPMFHPITIARILESETYKAFKAWNITDGSLVNYLKYFNLTSESNNAPVAGWTKNEGFEWLRQFQVVGTKYPELYETGKNWNINEAGNNNGIKGSYTQNTLSIDSLGGWVTSIPYSKDNLDKLKLFLDAQKIYPEIINNLNDEGTLYNTGNTMDNTRWCHVNRFTNASMCLGTAAATQDNTQLGWGGYYYPRTNWTPTYPATQSLQSALMCLFFDPLQENTYYAEPDTDFRHEYTYGVFGRSEAVGGQYFVTIYPNRHAINGKGSYTYNDLGQFVGGAVVIEAGRKFGFDLHFTAAAMNYISPMSGWTIHPGDKSSYASKIGNFIIPDAEVSGGLGTPTVDINKYKDRLYIGADNPSLSWDGTHFGFNGLHTGMNRGNENFAGNPLFGISPALDAAETVYKINFTEQYNDWTPDRTPYAFSDIALNSYQAVVGGTSHSFTIPRANHNCEKWKIYDMLCGIFIEDYGVSEPFWDDSLWGILGFSYQQFHSTTNNRQIRIQSGNSNQLSRLTTNAEVVEGDTKIYSTNWSGTPLYNNMINSPYNIMGYTAPPALAIDSNNAVFPPITHKTQSLTILADNLPARMLRGYYTIRSDILQGTPFIGGKRNNTVMPIIGIVDKENADGDFYFQQESSLSFTVTKAMRLASVSISIHDPSGEYASVSKQSTVLFKIIRNKITNFNIAEEFLKENPKNPILQNL